MELTRYKYLRSSWRKQYCPPPSPPLRVLSSPVSIFHTAKGRKVQEEAAQTQASELAPINIYPIYELLESVKGRVLQIQSSRNSMAQGSNNSPRGVPVRIQCRYSIQYSVAEARSFDTPMTH